MKKYITGSILVFLVATSSAFAIDGNELLKTVDRNLNPESFEMYRKLIRTFILSALFIVIFNESALPKTYTLASPDKTVKIIVDVEDRIVFRVLHNDMEIISNSSLGLELEDGAILGNKPRLRKAGRKAVRIELPPNKKKRGRTKPASSNALVPSVKSG